MYKLGVTDIWLYRPKIGRALPIIKHKASIIFLTQENLLNGRMEWQKIKTDHEAMDINKGLNGNVSKEF